MSYKITAGLAALLVTGFAGTALAQEIDAQNYNVNVNIQVEAEVSMWADDDNVSLVLDGADANNFKASESGINHINNVAADINVAVNGDIPAETVPGGGVLFYIFDNVGASAAAAAALANAYTPAGALVWSDANEGATQNFASDLPVSTSITPRLVTYAAATPGELPVPQNFDLDVVWTISEATP